MPEEINIAKAGPKAVGQLETIVGIITELLAQRDFESSLSVVLRRLVDYFRCNRSYIFEIDWEHNFFRNTYEECAAGISPQIENLGHLPLEVIYSWIEHFEKGHNLLHISDVEKIPANRASEYAVLSGQGIKELYVTPFFFDGKFWGFLGIDDPQKNVNDVSMLVTLSYLIFTELGKEREHRNKNKALSDYQRLLANIPGGIAIIDYNNSSPAPAYFSEGFCRMLKMTSQEAFAHFQASRVNEWLFHDDRQRVFNEFISHAIPGESFTTVFRLLNHKGELWWVRVNASTLDYNSDDLSYYLVCTDVTAEKEAEARLQSTEEYFSKALTESGIEMWELDIESHCAVKRGSPLHGGLVEEVLENIPESQIESGMIHPSSAAAYRALYSRLASGSKEAAVDVQVDGTLGWRWKHIKYIVTAEECGRPKSAVGILTDITEQKKAKNRYERELKARENLYGNAMTLTIQLNLNSCTVEYASPSYEPLLDNDKNFDTMLLRVSDLIPNPQQKEGFLNNFLSPALRASYAKDELRLEYEYQKMVEKETLKWVRTTARLVTRPGGNDIIVFFTTTDVNDEHISRELLNCVAHEDYDYIAYVDAPHNRYTMYASFSGANTPLPPESGYNYREEMKRYANNFVIEEEIDRIIAEMELENVTRQLELHKTYELTVHIKELDGQIRLKKLKYTYMDKENKIIRLTRIDITDIYEQMTENQKLRELSQRDDLTGLYDKRHFCELLKTAVNLPCEKWLLFIDLDDFKSVNDRFGHMTGDHALRGMASRLREIFSETGMIGRFGGDEFFVFLTEAKEAEVLKKAGATCHGTLLFCEHGKKEIRVSASVGICRVEGGISVSEALAQADEALYMSKAMGKGRHFIYHGHKAGASGGPQATEPDKD